jgi:hypothetical protein
MRISPQQDAKIIEPCNDALQLDAVYKENGHRGFVLSDMVQEHVLDVLRFLAGHGKSPIILGAGPTDSG